jgi:hypothetical protein
MNTLLVVFLAVIALCALVQAVFFAVAAVATLRAAARLDALTNRLEREWPEVRLRVESLSEDVAEVSRKARDLAERTELTADRVATATERAGHLVRAVASLPIGPVVRVVAVVRAIRYGLRVFRSMRAPSQA